MTMNYMRQESNPFKVIEKFEKTISEFYGAKYGIATDCCTHAIELCLRYEGYSKVTVPEHTYISIPFTCAKLGIEWNFSKDFWEESYYIGETNIIDGAVQWREESYIPGTYLCLSFQFKKHLSIGRGGMILTDDPDAYNALKKMVYDGRENHCPWGEQDIDSIGYHYYMTPENADRGLEQFYRVKNHIPRSWSYRDYPYLPNMKVFK
jgi:dTDP-4-amino-4,6-dideoxygalactose transaminase